MRNSRVDYLQMQSFIASFAPFSSHHFLFSVLKVEPHLHPCDFIPVISHMKTFVTQCECKDVFSSASGSEKERDTIRDNTVTALGVCMENWRVELFFLHFFCGVRRNLAVPTVLANPVIPNPFPPNSVVLPTVSESAEVHYGLVMHE